MSAALSEADAPETAWTVPELDPIERFGDTIMAIAAEHQPSRMPFFERLAALPSTAGRDPIMLGRIYLVYQSAMHATRAGVYLMPHLDSPALRRRKLQMCLNGDGLPDGDTYHYRLARAFRGIGAALPLDEEEFGDFDLLCKHLDRSTADFVHLVRSLYSRSLGAWCMVEALADDWMRALAEALAVHHPDIVNEPYFASCFAADGSTQRIAEALDITRTVLRNRPRRVRETLRDAEMMGDALDSLWDRLDAIVQAAG